MEGYKPEEDIESHEGESYPLVEAEATMLEEKGGEGMLSRLSERGKKFLRVVVATSALSGGFDLALASDGHTYELPQDAQKIYDTEYTRARGQADRQEKNTEVQSIRRTAHNDAVRDSVLSRDPNAIVNQAYQEEHARIEAQEARRLENYAKQVGKYRAQYDAHRPHGIFALPFILLNKTNEAVSGAIDKAIDGK